MNVGTSKQAGEGDRVSTKSLLGCSTSVALATGPTDEEKHETCAQCTPVRNDTIHFHTELQSFCALLCIMAHERIIKMFFRSCRLVFRMSTNVSYKRRTLPETSIAHATGIGFISSVDVSMLHESATVRETSTANLTAERFNTSVSSKMFPQSRTLRKSLVANFTTKRLITCVCPRMEHQMRTLRETFLAHFTTERFLSCMDS